MVAGSGVVPVLIECSAALLHHGRIHLLHPVDGHLRLTHRVECVQDIREHVGGGIVLLLEDSLDCRIFIRSCKTGDDSQRLYAVICVRVVIVWTAILLSVPEVSFDLVGDDLHHCLVLQCILFSAKHPREDCL